MAQKAGMPVYIMPTDFEEGLTETRLPNGKILTLEIRKEDVEHVKRLSKMKNTHVFKDPKFYRIFERLTIE